MLGKGFNFLMTHGSDAEALTRIRAEFEGLSSSGTEVLYRRKDGSEFWAALFVSPVRDSDGVIVQYFASLVDLTKHKEDEVRSRMLIDELNHRVKNTLSTVQSIVWQTLRTTTDLNAIRQSIESRLFALSRSHDLLTREKWEGAGLLDIARDALEPFGVSGGRADRIVITGENIRFPPKAALAVGIALNELATNAVEYGALSNAVGSIVIGWTMEAAPDGKRLLLRWNEKGGPLVSSPAHKGFGSRVLERGIAHALEGTVHLDYRPDGLVCTTFPYQEVLVVDKLLTGSSVCWPASLRISGSGRACSKQHFPSASAGRKPTTGSTWAILTEYALPAGQRSERSLQRGLRSLPHLLLA